MYRSYKIYKFLTALCPLAYSPLPTHLSFIKYALRSPSWPFLFDTRINVSLCLLSPTPPPKSFIQTIQVEKKTRKAAWRGVKCIPCDYEEPSWDPQFPQESWVLLWYPKAQYLVVGGRQIPGDWWPSSLNQMVNFRLRETPCLKKLSRTALGKGIFFFSFFFLSWLRTHKILKQYLQKHLSKNHNRECRVAGEFATR